MALTNAERNLKTLLLLWLILFGGGTIVLGVVLWLPIGGQLYADHPLLAWTWIGQALLFVCSLYFRNGLRDNELLAPVLTWYKLVSGTAMMLFLLSRAPFSESTLLVIGGGILDYLMGGLTFGLWLVARRARAVRMPLVFEIGSELAEEPDTAGVRALRRGLVVCAVLFSLAALAVLSVGLTDPSPRDSAFKIAAGNAVAVYAALAFLSQLAAETPRRRAYALDALVVCCLFAAVALGLVASRFAYSPDVELVLVGAALGHLVLAIAILTLSAAATRSERPSPFFGPWLHLVFERFADVILKGNVEVVTPRELADSADRILADVDSRRLPSIKIALALIELGSLVRLSPPMSRLGRLEREHYLTTVFRQGTGPFRSLIKIKQLIYFAYYSDERAQREVGFVPFEERESFRKAEESGELPTGVVAYPPPVVGDRLDADVCVIGSGAGGAIVASRLAEAGRRVVIVEEGSYLKRDRISHDDRAMQATAYREGGLQLTLDYDMYVLQGKCVGGSTFVNNGVCFDPPEAVLREWASLGAELDRAALDASLARIRRELRLVNLGDHPERVEKGSLKFVEGARRLGLEPGWFDVNFAGCLGCGHCTIGCSYEKKLSMDQSYVPRAIAAGAILVSDCKAEEIVTRGAVAQEVRCRRTDGSTLVVRAKKVVVAAGAIGSSLLLQRSGIRRNVGTRLSFNVGSWVFAEFPEPVNSFDGIQMCAYVERPKYTLETIAMSPGSFATAMPGWFQEHFERMRRYRHFAVAGALIGSQASGSVRPSSLPFVGQMFSPVDFTLSAGDLNRLRQGVRQVCRIQLAAGATRVSPATFQPLDFVDPAQLYQLDEVVVEADDLSFGSAHPQGGNPMSDDPKLGAVSSTFKVYGFDNLYVCDASVFPSSVRVNPQLTVMALADYAAGLIARE